MSTRPGPLKPWPVEHFYKDLQQESHLFKTPSRPNKRPHSPSVNPFSPTKRRLLNDAGIYVPGKASLRGRTASPAYVTQILQSPSSPARKLDFGSLNEFVQGKSLFSSSSSSIDDAPSSDTLAPSPRLLSGSSDEDASPFKRPVLPSLEPKAYKYDHFPGFVVHQDTSPPLFSIALPQPPLTKRERKENLRPVTAIPVSEKIVLSPDPKTAELQRKYLLPDSTPIQPSTTTTPKVTKLTRRRGSASPKKKTTRKTSVLPLPSPPREPYYMTRSATKADRRLVLEAEADGLF